MKSFIKILVAILFCLSIVPVTFGSETLFYVLHNNSSERFSTAQNTFTSLKNHFKSINILVAQAYQIDEHGKVWGGPDEDILKFAQEHSIKLMVLVTNKHFDKDMAHQFLTNPEAEQQAIQSILTACKELKCYGVQFDFEMIPLQDKDALTHFYVTAAQELHQHGYAVSFALAPVVSDTLQPSDFLKKVYVNWEGAYDFKKLGKAADFVTIMAYNQHIGLTTPGPTATIKWVEATIKYALQYIPPEKISLGIPSYSTYWFTGTNQSTKKLRIQSVGIDYKKLLYLMHKNKLHFAWDQNAKINYAIYEHNWLYEYIFAEDARSFTAKQALAKKYKLRGISVFDLGTEDPHIWNVIG